MSFLMEEMGGGAPETVLLVKAEDQASIGADTAKDSYELEEDQLPAKDQKRAGKPVQLLGGMHYPQRF